MNEYKYKPKINSLPKLNLTTLSTKYKSFYSNRSKNKTNSSNYNTFRITSTNPNTSIFSSGINSNEPDNLYSKTARNINLEDSKMKKKRKKKIISNIIYLTEIEKVQTDDNYFAMSEINKIDNTIKKRINKDIIWKEKPQNIYDIFSSKNRTDIKNIKKRVKQNRSGININLRKEVNKNNYFPHDNIETIQEAKEILSRIKNTIIKEKTVAKNLNHFNRVDLHTFREQNRDICLNNILINIIKSESNKLKKKENIVNTALKEANNDFEKDSQLFEKVTRNEIANFRNKEIKLDETVKQNRILIDEIRKRNSELYRIKEEVKKYVKDILLFINYENFIKKIIEKEKNDSINYNNDDNITFNNMNNDKDFDGIIKKIIRNYYMNKNNYQLILTEDITPQMMVNLFISMESNIMNALEERNLIIKEISEDKKKYAAILDDLKLKVEQNRKDLDILLKEINIVFNITTPKKDMKEIIEENKNHIITLNKELSKYIKDKTIIKTDNICFDTFRLLHILQDKSFNIMNELDKITENNENSEIFEEIIEQIKMKNKREKQMEKKSLQQKIFEEKNKKIQQRMLRFKVRGPITFPPPWAINKSKKNIQF